MSNETWNDTGLECPYCGDVDEDAFDHWAGGRAPAELLTKCYNCGREYKASREFAVTYIATPTDADDDPEASP